MGQLVQYGCLDAGENENPVVAQSTSKVPPQFQSGPETWRILGECQSSVDVRRLKKMGSDVSEGGSSSNSNTVDALTSKEQKQTRNSSTTFLWDTTGN